MKREDLEAREFGLIIASSNFPFYAAPEADAVMDAMERRIARLSKCVEMWKKVNEDLQRTNTRLRKAISLNSLKEIEYMSAENADLKKKVKEPEVVISKMETTQKWISVKDRSPNIGDIVLVYFDERVKSHYYPIDVVRWDSSYQLQEISVTHWMPLPSAPTTEDSSDVEKEK